MKLIIRADGDSKIGTGHIMRCIALAQGWQDQGGEVTFISRCESVSLKERIQSEGFGFIGLDHVCPDSSDLGNTLSILNNGGADRKDWLVLDGYHFTPDYQKAIRDAGIHLLVIDDMNHLPHYHADILLNQNIHAPDLHYHCDEDTTLLLGTRYVLLRREFLKYREFKRQIPDRAKNILVTLGGADPNNVTLKVIEALILLDEADISVRIIIGPANPHQEILRKAIASAHFEVELLINPLNVPELMAWADMAISAGGSTCWELAFMGVPMITFILAENQIPVAEGIAKEGFAINLGGFEGFNTKTTSYEIYSLIQSKERRLNMAQKGKTGIKGTSREILYDILLSSMISIRPVQEYDCELIWKWANDPDVLAASFCSDVIPLKDHKIWFYSKLNDPCSNQYIGYNKDKQPIGQIRFDKVEEREYEIDISIDKLFRARGYGTTLIRHAICALNNNLELDVIHAHVKFNNRASRNVFIKAGFISDNNTIIKNIECYHLKWKRD